MRGTGQGRDRVLLVSGSSFKDGCRLEDGWRQANLIMMVQRERTVIAGGVVGGWKARFALERNGRGRISEVESLWMLVERQREVLCMGDDGVTYLVEMLGSVWVVLNVRDCGTPRMKLSQSR